MNQLTLNPPQKPRKPWLALLLSFFALGLGQVYNGRLKRGIALLLIPYAVMLLSTLTGVLDHFYGLIASGLIGMATGLFVIGDAFFLSRKLKEIPLKTYNRWYIYLVFIVIYHLFHAGFKEVAIPYKAYKIPSSAMVPTLIIGDHLWAQKSSKIRENLQRGDIVTFPYPRQPTITYIKRIIALGGETIQIIDNQVLINDQPLEEPYVYFDPTSPPELKIEIESPVKNFGPVQVPEGKLFVMGDNRYNSADSRFWGFVAVDQVKAKPLFLYWSPQTDRMGRDIR